MVAHGGAVGEGLYWAATTLFQRLGAHILVAPDARLRRPAAHRDDAGRRPRQRPGGRCARPAPAPATSRAPCAPSAPPAADPWEAAPDAPITISRERETETFETERLAAELDDEDETIADPRGRRRRTGRPTDDPCRSPPPSRPPVEPEPAGADRARRPRRWARRRSRDGVTESEEVAYRLPPAKVLDRGRADPGPDMRDREATAAALLESLRHFGVEARLLGHGQRPAREPLRAPARARDQGLQGRPAQGRPRLRARLDRHPHPRADPGQEGGRGRGPEPAPAPGPPRRHLRRAAEGLLAAALLARQGRLRRGGERRPGADAARARRRHHRLGEVGLHQRDPDLDPHARLAERGAAGARRPQAGRAQPLRARPAPAHARWSPTRAWRRTCSPT